MAESRLNPSTSILMKNSALKSNFVYKLTISGKI